MDWIVVEGVPPYDGRYEFDLAGAEPTTREWGWIKRLSGYLPATIGEGLEGADPELFSVFAVIALRRAGRIEARDAVAVFEQLADAPFSAAIRLETDQPDQQEDDAQGPPPSSSSRNGASSGASSETSSESSDSDPKPTGTPASATSESVPARWEN